MRMVSTFSPRGIKEGSRTFRTTYPKEDFFRLVNQKGYLRFCKDVDIGSFGCDFSYELQVILWLRRRGRGIFGCGQGESEVVIAVIS